MRSTSVVIASAAASAHQAVGLQTVDQFDGAVMLERHPFGQSVYRRERAFGQAAYSEEHQILLRLEI